MEVSKKGREDVSGNLPLRVLGFEKHRFLETSVKNNQIRKEFSDKIFSGLERPLVSGFLPG